MYFHKSPKRSPKAKKSARWPVNIVGWIWRSNCRKLVYISACHSKDTGTGRSKGLLSKICKKIRDEDFTCDRMSENEEKNIKNRWWKNYKNWNWEITRWYIRIYEVWMLTTVLWQDTRRFDVKRWTQTQFTLQDTRRFDIERPGDELKQRLHHRIRQTKLDDALTLPIGRFVYIHKFVVHQPEFFDILCVLASLQSDHIAFHFPPCSQGQAMPMGDALDRFWWFILFVSKAIQMAFVSLA